MSEQIETKLNENVIHFTGSLSILEGVEVDKTYRVGIDVEVYERAKRSRQDGTHNVHFKGKIVGGEIIKDNGGIIKSKNKDSPSNKMRKQILGLGYDYESTINLLMANLEDVLLELKNQ